MSQLFKDKGHKNEILRPFDLSEKTIQWLVLFEGELDRG